jgi:uncharacterized zinc-type alcohol dehydrogenase-like protein
MPVNAYAAMSAGRKLETFQYEPKELGPWDIEVKITHCGICYSDIHLIDNDWQMSNYPLVPGHEIIGIVTDRGPNVDRFEKGQRVGIGWQIGSCLTCESCLRGQEQLCAQHMPTCVAGYGGFAEAIRADSRFAYSIPDTLESEHAGPLLCAGITVYSPLRNHGIQGPMRVGVIGIGGLGHLALQFARAFGCEVTAFSSTPEKEAEAKSFGAHHYITSTDGSQLEKAVNSLDFIINTVDRDLDWATFVNVLRPNGKLCFVGAPANPICVPAFPLVTGQRSVCGSVVGGRADMQEMLEFAARCGIRPKTESVPMSRVNEAIQKVRDNKARYRMVVSN